MLGAATGDIIGSIYEHHNHRSKVFPLFGENSRFTDDTVMTAAVTKALTIALRRRLNDRDLIETLKRTLSDYGAHYPHRGYGGSFKRWINSEKHMPYNSWGNGAPMRCSAAGWLANSPERAFVLGMYTAAPTHNHPEAMLAAGLTAQLIWHARHGMAMEELRDLASRYYDLPIIDEIRDTYRFDVSCVGTMPVALAAFFESTGFEDAIRNAVSAGGDSDTIAAITGSLAEAYYDIPQIIKEKTVAALPDEFICVFDSAYRFAASPDEQNRYYDISDLDQISDLDRDKAKECLGTFTTEELLNYVNNLDDLYTISGYDILTYLNDERLGIGSFGWYTDPRNARNALTQIHENYLRALPKMDPTILSEIWTERPDLRQEGQILLRYRTKHQEKYGEEYDTR